MNSPVYPAYLRYLVVDPPTRYRMRGSLGLLARKQSESCESRRFAPMELPAGLDLLCVAVNPVRDLEIQAERRLVLLGQDCRAIAPVERACRRVSVQMSHCG